MTPDEYLGLLVRAAMSGFRHKMKQYDEMKAEALLLASGESDTDVSSFVIGAFDISRVNADLEQVEEMLHGGKTVEAHREIERLRRERNAAMELIRERYFATGWKVRKSEGGRPRGSNRDRDRRMADEFRRRRAKGSNKSNSALMAEIGAEQKPRPLGRSTAIAAINRELKILSEKWVKSDD